MNTKISIQNIEQASEIFNTEEEKNCFINFMDARFPVEKFYTTQSYAMEWAKRIQQRRAHACGDHKTRDCLRMASYYLLENPEKVSQ